MKQILSFLVALALTGVAHAHTELAATTPADGSRVAAAPEQLTLRFSAPVTLTMLAVRAADGSAPTLGALPTAPSASFAVAVPTLASGTYVVAWRALSADTHVVRGEFTFSVGDAATATGAADTPPPPPDHGTHTEHR